MKKDKSRIYTIITSVAAFAQMYLPQLHLPDITAQITSTVLLTIASVFTILKQRSSVEVNSKSEIYTWILIGITAVGGVNEVLGYVQFNTQWQNALRSIFAAILGLLNLASKELFPTEAGEIIQNVKNGIKEGTIQVASSTEKK